MPGLLGGGGGSQTSTGAPVNVPITAIAPAWAKNAPTSVSQPGQLYDLASNLAGGGFGGIKGQPGQGQSGLYSWLQHVYAPTAAPKVTPKVVAPKPKTPPVSPAGPSARPRVVPTGGRNAR